MKKLGVVALVVLAAGMIALAALGSPGSTDGPAAAPSTTAEPNYGTAADYATLTGRIGAVYPGVPLDTVKHMVAATCQDIAAGKVSRDVLVERVQHRLEGGTRPDAPITVAEVVLTGLEQIPSFCTIQPRS
jgi:hypothetical protein